MSATAAPIEPYRRDWRRGKVMDWITTTDHKKIGILYVAASLVFFALGGVMALIIRSQLARPDQTIVQPDTFNSLFTLHGTAMVFLFIVPLFTGLANYLVPLMIGAHDMAFPRLNAFSFWLFLFGGIVLTLSPLAEGGAAASGWTAYTPLSTLQSGNGQDLWILSLHLVAVSSVAGAINFIVTIHRMRTAGMTWMRMPLFVWSIEVFAALLLLVLPAISVAITMLLSDRIGWTSFFDPAENPRGPLLWQHLFWFFGHPEVYIIILPAFGIISELIPVFSRKPIFGYKAIALSTAVIGFLSLLVWAHHMFAVGLGDALNIWFMIASMIIAVPTGIKIINWIATTWRGNIQFDTPMLFALGFILVFTLGGLSGIFLAAYPFDYQAHDSYFVVAHMHYVLFGGAVMAAFGGLYYWWPKMFGRMLSERLGKWNFWLVLIGMNLTFGPLHLVGLDGMPRRVATYFNEEWADMNMLATIGSFVMAIGVLVFFINIAHTAKRGKRVGNDPWLADTLEWYASSPPAPHNFDRVPYISSARPLRDLRNRLAEGRGA